MILIGPPTYHRPHFSNGSSKISLLQEQIPVLATNLTTSTQNKWLGLTAPLLGLLAECGEPKYAIYLIVSYTGSGLNLF